jgi:hypothetical protein
MVSRLGCRMHPADSPRANRSDLRGTIQGQFGTLRPIAEFRRRDLLSNLEAPSGFEPEMEVLQTSALPLGDGAHLTVTVRLKPDTTFCSGKSISGTD